MKKLIFLFAFAMMAISISAQKSAIKTGPIAFALGYANTAFEYQIANKMSVSLRAGYFFGGKIIGAGATAFNVGAGFRYYLKQRKNLSGFYLEPIVDYTGITGGSGVLGFGALIGYQIRWDGGFILDLGAGPRIYDSGFVPSIKIAIGYALGGDGDDVSSSSSMDDESKDVKKAKKKRKRRRRR